MSNPMLSLGVTGIGTGALYAAVAIGLVVTYRGAGVINFSQSLIGLWAAYCYLNLHTEGTLTLPLIGIPANISLGGPLPMPAALALALLNTMVVASLIYFLVFRPLSNRPALARIVASVGVLTTMQSLVVIRFGTDIRVVDSMFPSDLVTWGPLTVTQDRLWLAAEVIAVAVVVGLLLHRTRVGAAVRTASESEAVLSYAGWSPAVIGLITWIGGALCTAVVAMPAASISGVDSSSYSLLIVPGLAAALVGRLNSVAVACVSGLLLGMLQSELTFLATKSWWPSWAVTGFGDAIPFVIVAIYLVVRGTGLPTRESAVAIRLAPFIRRPTSPVLTAVAVAAGIAALFLTSGTIRYGVITSMTLAIACLSLVVLTGLLGQISFAQIAIAGVAGFLLSRFHSSVGGALLAIVLATIAGVVVGFPALRIRGIQLAVVTLAAAFAVQQFVFGNPKFNGATGNDVTGPKIGSWNLSVRSTTEIATVRYGLLVLVVLTLGTIGTQYITNHGLGRRFLAVRSNENAAASVGINVARTKLIGFAIASGLAAVSGVMIAYSRSQVSAASYGVLAGVTLLTAAFLGGINRISGAVIGGVLAPLGALYTTLNYFVDLGQYYALLSGVGLILATCISPQGAAGSIPQLPQRVLDRIALSRRPPSDRAAGAHPAADRAGRPGAEAPPVRSARLEVSHLTVSYGGVTAVSNVNLTIEPGTVVGLIGPNGAGKSSLVDAISGFARCDGQIRLDGHRVDHYGAHQRCREGIGRTWQTVDLFTDLTVRENLRVAADRSMRAGSRRTRGAAADALVSAALTIAGVETLGDDKPDQLTAGQQKLVGLARCLAGNPAVVLLDEPGAGLTSAETVELTDRVRGLARAGHGVLLIDHDVPLVMQACDVIYVLELGEVIAHGTPTEIRSDPRVQEAYLGLPAAPNPASSTATGSATPEPTVSGQR